jgi:hypothetical protein
MKKISIIILILSATVLGATGVKAGTITLSSDNLNFSQPLSVLSDPTTTFQLGYDFNVYHNWLCMDLRGRTAQQSGSQTMVVNNGDGIALDRITVMPSFDAGVRVNLINNYPFDPYVFSLLNYTTISSTTGYADSSATSDISAFGFRAGIGTDVLMSSQLPSWLFNIDMGYQYLPVTIAKIGSINMNGIFLSMGFGLNF